METAGKQVEDEELAEAMKERGLGTPATRAAIVDRLIQVGYAERKKKSIVATEKGVHLIEAVKSLLPLVVSAEMTGEWEFKLKQIERGQNTYRNFMQEIKGFVREEVDRLKSQKINYQGENSQGKGKGGGKGGKVMGKCPLCGSDIIEGKKGFGCSAWKSKGCKFVIWKEIAGKKLTKNQVKMLLEKGETSKIKGFTSKKGKKFDAKLRLVGGKVEFCFD
jgi:DNA topoisomerase-3